MFDKLDQPEKIKMIEKFSHTKLSKNFCSHCSTFTKEDSSKYKCIHRNDCMGLCKVCYDSMGEDFEYCISCNKKQVKECPICCEEKDEKSLALFDSCNHSCCWKCISHSFMTNNPIKNCPECRKEIAIEFK